MPTETLPTRSEQATPTKEASGFGSAVILHVAVVAAVAAFAFIEHERASRYGDQDPTAGSIQASMVTALPLPPRKAIDKNVLASDNPSIAPKQPPPEPTQTKSLATPLPPKAAPPEHRDDILIPKKDASKAPPKATEHDTAAKRPTAAPPPPTDKATTGSTASVQIPAAISQLKNGTASITVEERAFGDRYAYYIQQISRKVNQSWSEQQVDEAGARGKHTTVTFTIDRAGEPIDAHITTPSGSGVLDSAALHTIQRIDTFGPLPAGNNIVIAFSFDFHTQ
jgi:protein TonB